MNILVLEDDDCRMAKIYNQLFNHKVTRVTTVSEAIKSLNQNSYDYIMLDHDLGDEHYELYKVQAFGGETWVPKEPTGMRAAEHIANNTINVKAIIVHSLNNVQAPKMVKLLEEAGYLATWWPYCWQSNFISVIEESISHGY